MTKENKKSFVKGLVTVLKYSGVFLLGVGTAGLIYDYGDAMDKKKAIDKYQEENREKISGGANGTITNDGKTITHSRNSNPIKPNMVTFDRGDYIEKVDINTGFKVITPKAKENIG